MVTLIFSSLWLIEREREGQNEGTSLMLDAPGFCVYDRHHRHSFISI